MPMKVRDLKALVACIPSLFDDREIKYVDFNAYDTVHVHDLRDEGLCITPCDDDACDLKIDKSC